MLTYAIQDEYAAQAEYDAVMDKYRSIRPYSNIIRSETVHIGLLLPLLAKHGATVLANDFADRTVVPGTLRESYRIGVDAEIKNIAMYQSFLKENLPADVKTVFEWLSNESENHLKALEKATARARNGDVRGKRMKGRFRFY